MKAHILVLSSVAMALASVALFVVSHRETPPPVHAIEVGKVAWGRDFDAACAQSKKSGKPMLVLFQEVPGCTGCQKFGREVLSDAQIVKAIEENFIPVLICNNHEGRDAELLKRFGEPAWNYQVVRFLTAEGRDLIPREDQVWTVPALSARILKALQAAGRPAPSELHAPALGKAS